MDTKYTRAAPLHTVDLEKYMTSQATYLMSVSLANLIVGVVVLCLQLSVLGLCFSYIELRGVGVVLVHLMLNRLS
jgi:hypothetical protein